jgi:hypothetical protein
VVVCRTVVEEARRVLAGEGGELAGGWEGSVGRTVVDEVRGVCWVCVRRHILVCVGGGRGTAGAGEATAWCWCRNHQHLARCAQCVTPVLSPS